MENNNLSVKRNCWEYMNCGRGPVSEHSKNVSSGSCPAVEETKLDGVHGGSRAGRACWLVAGTFCEGEPQGAFAQKYETCKNCGFYQMVIDEEGPRLELTMNLMKRLR